MSIEAIKAEILADIEKREAKLAAMNRFADGAPEMAMDYQAPKLMRAIWTVGITQFALTWQEDEVGNSIMLMMNRGAGWVGWGGVPEYRATIVERVTVDAIERLGNPNDPSLLDFFNWLLVESDRRANFIAGLSYPDPNDKMARVRFVIENLLTAPNNRLQLPQTPLGVAPT